MYEVELKFPLPDADRIVALLTSWKVDRSPPVVQCDTYYNHPARDFKASDEALRIRQIGTENRITYKGPVVDSQTKTRREIELGFDDGAGAADRFATMLELLGFRRVRQVRKQRVTATLVREGRTFELALDNVEGLGSYLEIETQADESQRIEAQQAVLDLARELGLSNAERLSYLGLLMDQEEEHR